MVDLQDPDVRRMLTELVTFEIDQAADFRRRGQTIDAVLQLTEAEKVSRALGMTESAKRIRAMMAGDPRRRARAQRLLSDAPSSSDSEGAAESAPRAARTRCCRRC